MIRVLLVADSGPVMAAVTEKLWRIPAVEIAGHASGRTRVAGLVLAVQPDVVVIDQMRRTGMATTRIAEVREADPAIAIVGLSERADVDWVADGLRAGASAVVPRELGSAAMSAVLHEVLDVPRMRQVSAATERSAA